MNIQDFVAKYHNHPVLFVGTGLSLRYLKNSYSWDGLLQKVANELNSNPEYYLDIKAENMQTTGYAYDKIAAQLEMDFNQHLKENRDGKFKATNDKFYEKMKANINISRFKLYLAELLGTTGQKSSAAAEIAELKKASKNISSVITTNYDTMIEQIFSFAPLVGNNILLSNPYGSVYKIHGCVSQPDKIIITEKDYIEFSQKYELIRAQLLSLFIHNPIIFIGYNIGDKNIKDILRTIFSYVDYNSEEAKKIRDNFLLIEYESGADNTEVTEHDIDIEGFDTIRINKLKTDNYIAVYKALDNLTLPVSVMDIRKVQTVVRDIYEGGTIKVSITEDLDELKNSDKVLVVGSKKTINYVFMTTSEIMANYFEFVEESNSQSLQLINNQKIQSTQFFPIYAFSKICPGITRSNELKKQQKEKIEAITKGRATSYENHTSPQAVLDDQKISQTNKTAGIICSIMSGAMDLSKVEEYLINFLDKRSTDYRKLLCAFDLKSNE